MFAECHISLNDRQISLENNHAYKAYNQTMLFHSESSQKNLLSAGLFVKDTAGKFDDATLTDAGLNKGLRKRWDRVKNGKVFDMCGILHTDIGTQSKLLKNGTSIRIRLIKAKNEFSLLAATGDYHLQIENISIYVTKCEISSSILVAHEKALEQSLKQIPFTRIEVKTFTVSSGLKSVIIPNGVNGVLPSRIILGLISNSAFNGDMRKNPFNFKRYNLNHISLSENAQHKTNVSYDDYKENICLYVFDLTQDKSASEPFGNVTRSGDISIHLKFDAELPETATLIAYMEMPSLIEIDKSRNNVVLRKDISDKRIVYFKILNNSEIVQYIHNDAQEECFGFRQVHRTDPNDKFKVFSPNKRLFVNLLDCVLEARDITSDEDLSPPSSGSHEVKIPPYNVYLGKGAAIEQKEFRKGYYIAFSKTADGEIRNSCQVIYSQFGLAMHQNDHQARRRFVEWVQNEIAVVPDFHKRILFSDEAHFWLNGYVNKQNCRIWSDANPQV
ncbi:uncharacterized protein TNCV_3563681 [Trichonephila clavipes]|nr:uncharacterized protein TNCV_3563681 [Trichonephila clavipes]